MDSRLRRTVVALAAAVPILVIGPAQGSAQAQIGQPGTQPPPMTCDRHLAVGNRTVYEGTRTEADNTAYTYVSFTVSSSGCTAAGSVEYFTFPGSATAGVDYLSTSGSLRYTAGQTGARTVTVRVVKDSSPGGSEVFHLFITDPSDRVTIDDGFGTATVLNDDAMCTPPWDWIPPPGNPDYHCSE